MLEHEKTKLLELQLSMDCKEHDYTVLIEEIQVNAHKEAKGHSEDTIGIFKAKLEAEKDLQREYMTELEYKQELY